MPPCKATFYYRVRKGEGKWFLPVHTEGIQVFGSQDTWGEVSASIVPGKTVFLVSQHTAKSSYLVITSKEIYTLLYIRSVRPSLCASLLMEEHIIPTRRGKLDRAAPPLASSWEKLRRSLSAYLLSPHRNMVVNWPLLLTAWKEVLKNS